MLSMIDYTKKKEMYAASEESQRFIAKRILRDVEIIAKRKNVSEEYAYEMYRKGIWTA